MQVAFPVLVGRQHPEGHPSYPQMGSFFDIQGGGGHFPDRPSPPTSRAATEFLERAGMPEALLEVTRLQSVAATVRSLTALQVIPLVQHCLLRMLKTVARDRALF